VISLGFPGPGPSDPYATDSIPLVRKQKKAFGPSVKAREIFGLDLQCRFTVLSCFGELSVLDSCSKLYTNVFQSFEFGVADA
jgi:hypothetical protein